MNTTRSASDSLCVPVRDLLFERTSWPYTLGALAGAFIGVGFFLDFTHAGAIGRHLLGVGTTCLAIAWLVARTHGHPGLIPGLGSLALSFVVLAVHAAPGSNVYLAFAVVFAASHLVVPGGVRLSAGLTLVLVALFLGLDLAQSGSLLVRVVLLVFAIHGFVIGSCMPSLRYLTPRR